MREMIMQAIREKRVLDVRYHDYFRTIEPHAFGQNRKGRYILRCYQTAGGSVSGSPADWKLLLLDEVRSIAMNGAFFPGPRFGYKRGDQAIERIFAEL